LRQFSSDSTSCSSGGRLTCAVSISFSIRCHRGKERLAHLGGLAAVKSPLCQLRSEVLLEQPGGGEQVIGGVGIQLAAPLHGGAIP
jgi:hypothetical protein